MRRFFNNIKVIATVVVTLTAFCATSCLNKEPGAAIDEKEAIKTFDDVKQLRVGIYAMLKSGALYSGYLTLLPDLQCDLVYAVEGFSNNHGNIWQWDIRPTNSEIESVYATLYSLISNCNYFLDTIGGVLANETNDDNIDAMEQYTGEIHTIRALAYSELVKCFCKAYDPVLYCVHPTSRRSPLYVHRLRVHTGSFLRILQRQKHDLISTTTPTAA